MFALIFCTLGAALVLSLISDKLQGPHEEFRRAISDQRALG